MMNITLRTEKEKDYDDVFELIKAAFSTMEHSDHREQFLVQRLRKSNAFVPQLAIVAESEGRIVGHILLTRIAINDNIQRHSSLALAPVSVHPEMQRRGVGGRLINHAHEVARKLGFTSIILLGHQDYYPRFGYRRADEFDINLPFDVPRENCMAIELVKDSLKHVQGMVEYPSAFFE